MAAVAMSLKQVIVAVLIAVTAAAAVWDLEPTLQPACGSECNELTPEGLKCSETKCAEEGIDCKCH